MKTSLVILSLVLVGATLAHEFAPDTDVVILDESNFDAITGITGPEAQLSKTWFIAFYAPWCGHCKHMLPTWEQLATQIKDSVSVAVVDCDANPSLAKRFGIRGYPTVLLFSKDGKFYKYQNKRDIDTFSAFALGGYANQDGATIPEPAEPGTFDFLEKIGIVPITVGICAAFVLILVCVFAIPDAKPTQATSTSARKSTEPGESQNLLQQSNVQTKGGDLNESSVREEVYRRSGADKLDQTPVDQSQDNSASSSQSPNLRKSTQKRD